MKTDNLWMATWGSKPGRSTMDHAKRSALSFSVASTMTWSLLLKFVPSLKAFPDDSSSALVSSTSLVHDPHPILGSMVITIGSSCSMSTPWKLVFVGGILRRLCVRVIVLTYWILLRCHFQADEVHPPSAKLPNIVFMVSCNGGRSEILMSVCVKGWFPHSCPRLRWSCWRSKSESRLPTKLELLSASLLTNLLRWLTRINSLILSSKALHSFVVCPLLRWYLQYLVMSAFGGLSFLRGGGGNEVRL